jgi:hypothetical protein
MRAFHHSCGGCRGSLSGLKPVNQAGGVNIIDTLAARAVPAIQSGGPKPFNMLTNLALTGCKLTRHMPLRRQDG